MKRKIIEIDENKCNGCGLCIPECPEGALQIIDGKARLVSDLFCDGLGACIGSCPQGAIRIIEREAEPYSERKVMERIVRQGSNVIKAHLEHLKEHGEEGYLREALDFLKEKGIENPLDREESSRAHSHHHACPGSRMIDMREKTGSSSHPDQRSELRQWPVQLHLVPPNAPYFRDSSLVIAADCVPFAYPNFHRDFLRGNSVAIGCPKLDDTEAYAEKISQIIRLSNPKSVTVVHMEVPCCYGLVRLVEEAARKAGYGKDIKDVTITISGEKAESE